MVAKKNESGDVVGIMEYRSFSTLIPNDIKPGDTVNLWVSPEKHMWCSYDTIFYYVKR